MPSNSSMKPMNTIWKSVWSLQVPRKIQMFMWRALKDSLPTKLNLKRRHILMDLVCELCQSTTEDILHVVWRCPQVQSAWAKEDWMGEILKTEATELLDVWSRVSELKSPKALALFSTMCWAFWNRRNKLKVHKPKEKLNRIASFVRGFLEEFRTC